MRTLVGAVALAGVLLLAGCDGGDPIPTLPPTPSATPIFASEEEALAAAEEAYAAYQAAVDHALQTLDDEGLADVATGVALDAAISSVEDFKESARHQVGSTEVVFATPANLAPLLDGHQGELSQIYACIDLSLVSVVGPDGEASQSPVEILPMIVGIVWEAEGLLVAEEDVWDGSNFCD